MPHFSKQDIGLRQRRVESQVRKVGIRNRSIISIWGFGSYFRSGPFRDLDLLICMRHSKVDNVATSAAIKKTVKDSFARFSVPVDVLVLTPSEVLERPLVDMHTLNLLFKRNCIDTVAFGRNGL